MKKIRRKKLPYVIFFIGILVIFPLFLIFQHSRYLEVRVRNFQTYNQFDSNIYEDLDEDIEILSEIPENYLYLKATLSISDWDDIFIKGLFFLLAFSIGDIFQIITKTSDEETAKKSTPNDEIPISNSEIELTLREREILHIVQDYLDESRPLVLHDALNYLNSRISKEDLNVNSVGAFKILRSLEIKGLIKEGSTLTRNDILENENRKRIYDFITDNPGVYSNQIVKELNISRYTVDWHITKLLEFNFIEKYQINNFEVYADVNTPKHIVRISHFILKHKSGRILELLLKEETGLSIYKLSKLLNIHYKTIEKYIKQFMEYNFVEKIQSSSSSFIYSLNGKYSNLLRKRLFNK